MIDREKVRDAICKAVISRGPGPSYSDAADAAIAAVLEQLREPVPPLQNWRGVFVAGSNDRHGLRLSQEVCADIVQAIDEAFLQATESPTPAE